MLVHLVSLITKNVHCASIFASCTETWQAYWLFSCCNDWLTEKSYRATAASSLSDVRHSMGRSKHYPSLHAMPRLKAEGCWLTLPLHRAQIWLRDAGHDGSSSINLGPARRCCTAPSTAPGGPACVRQTFAGQCHTQGHKSCHASAVEASLPSKMPDRRGRE